ncbi:MAG: hypothetical protein FWC10_09265, partial [Lentimicrobiaceae bacterium]|nr:hypothetical protein [Lentimicrobiaceae bacterium]
MEENTQFSDSTVGKIISNLSITLSHVKDALLKDFLEDMSSYIPGITAATSYKDFETYLEKAYKDKTMPAHFSVFINGLFERLGYNISNYEKDTKLQDLVKAIIATTFNFKDLINSLLNGNTDWQKEVMDILNATEAGAEEKMPAIKKLFNDPDLNKIGEESSSFAAGFMFGDGLLSKIIQLIIQIVTLCKQVKNLQLDDLKRADEKFGAFMEATNFSQQFAARIFDHIMVILIRNGKELFAADLDVVLDVLLDTKENKDKAKALEDKIKKDLEKKLKEEGKNLVETEFQTSITQIKDLRKKVKELEKQTTGAASILLKNTKAELSKLTKELFPDYDTIGKVFSKIYAVLDFLKVFDEELIEVVEYGKDLAAQIDLSKINEYITTINEGDDSSDEKADALKKAKKALKSPISKLNVIKWNNLEKLCTKPVDYITSLYPIKDFDDAEKLLAKILKLIKIFSDGTLDFDSLRKLLYEFATRIWNLFKNAKEDAKQELLKLQNFIIDLIKVHEKFAIGVKNELTKAFDEFLSGADAAESIIDKLVNEYIVKELEKLKEKGKIPGTNIKFKKLRTLPETEWKEQLSRLYATPLAALLNEKAQADKAFNKISQTEWEGFVTGQLLTDYYTAIGNMEEYISELYDAVDNWEDKFKKLIKELKEDFTKNIGKKIADSPHLINSLWKKPLSEMEGYIKKIEENINKNEDLKKSYTHLHFLLVETGEEKTPYKYPFSDFDYVEYFSNFANKIKNIAPCDLDSIYYLKFKEITISAISDKLKAKGIAEDKARAFLANVFSAFWADMKTLLYKNLIRPYASVIEKSVKSWLKEVLIHNIFDEITQRIDDHLNFEQYKDIFSKDNFTSVGVKMIQEKDSLDVGESWGASPIVLAKKLLALGIELKDISSLSDGIKFITNLYKAIKPDLLKKLSGVVELPMLDFSNIALPSYKLDIQNKFFALTVYEYPEKKEGESKKEDEQNGISLKLVAFAGERKLDSDGEEVESGIFLLPVIRGNYNNKGFALGQNHILKLGVTGSLNNDFSKETVTEAGKKAALENELFGFFLTNKSSNPLHTSLEYLNNDALQIYLELLFERTKDNPLQIFNAEYAALKVDNYPQKIFAGLNKGAFDFGYLGKLDKMEFALKLHKLNAFFEKILKDDIIIKLSKLELGYSWAEGLRVDGAFKVRIPIQNNFDLSIVKFNDIMLELGASTFNKNAITASLLTNFNVDFSGINISFTEMGLALNINYKSPDGSFGDFDLMPKFQFPSGLGIAIDIGPVTGGGLVRWNKEKEEFFGALELTIANVGGISALLLFNLRMPDGSKGFSFMGAISMFFTPGLPLPMGFSLTGVGGTFGLNRKIETDKLRDAIRCGALESILLVKDLENNLDFVLANAAQYYPVQQNQHFFGILAQLTWTKILKADLGLFIQFPKPMVVIIAGSIRI